jgi:diguanylate cyclase (GGDEF)-like protein
MGIGIWSMHYLGMLAVQLPVPVYYHWPTVLLSLGMGVAASAVTLLTIVRPNLRWRHLSGGSLLMGAGIGGMHYTGMAAMRSGAMEHYNPSIVALSVLAAIGFSWLALWTAFAVRDSEHRGAGILRVAGGCIMGLGIASMHYIAMSAATFTEDNMPFSMADTVRVNLLGQTGVATTTVLILLAALGTAALDKRRFLDLREANAKLEESQNALKEGQRQLQIANEMLSEMSLKDGLTGLFNRRHFDATLDAEWRRGFRTRRAISMLMIDIDSFKELNDRYGHLRGDDCLRQIGQALQQHPRRGYDLIARYGGEEFVLLLPETELDSAVNIAESIRQTVKRLGLANKGSSVDDVVTVSIGVASRIPDASENATSIVGAADSALYAAKRNGKDRVEIDAPIIGVLDRHERDFPAGGKVVEMPFGNVPAPRQI